MGRHIRSVTFVGSFTSHLPVLGLPEVAFAGRSNVGKSSALNCLLQRKKAARVSSRPGRTQAINLFNIDDDCVFADLPGYGFAKVPESVRQAWKIHIDTYLAGRDALRLVVVLVDARRDPLPMDHDMLMALAGFRVPALVVATKIDKLKRSQRGRQLKKIRQGHGLSPAQLIPFSAVTGEGRDDVWEVLGASMGPARESS